jgi:transposase
VGYCRLLEEVIAPYIHAVERQTGTRLILMQDNAPCHKAKSVMAKITELGLSTFKWPASSPDLNPIENAWSIWKRRRRSQYGFPANRLDLEHQALSVWRNFTLAEAHALVNSFKKRLPLVVKENGYLIRY